jgi:hypothetical protein
LQSKDVAASARVAGLFDYFDGERSLPLKTKNLSEGWSDAVPDQLMGVINENLESFLEVGHWGIGDSGEMIRFMKEDPFGPVEPPAVQPPPLKKTTPPKLRPPKPIPPLAGDSKNKKFTIGFAAAAVIALILLIKPFHRHKEPGFHKDPPADTRSEEEVPGEGEITDGGIEETQEDKPSQVGEDEKPNGDHAQETPQEEQNESLDGEAPTNDGKPGLSESVEEESTEQGHPNNQPEQSPP